MCLGVWEIIYSKLKSGKIELARLWSKIDFAFIISPVCRFGMWPQRVHEVSNGMETIDA